MDVRANDLDEHTPHPGHKVLAVGGCETDHFVELQPLREAAFGAQGPQALQTLAQNRTSGSAIASIFGQNGAVRLAQAGEHVVLARAEIEIRAVPSHHLAWVEKSKRVGLTLERQQRRVGTTPAALL